MQMLRVLRICAILLLLTPLLACADFNDTVKKIPPGAIVSVRVTSDAQTRLPQEGVGSGWVIKTGGYIITNRHVVQNAQRISVAFYDPTRQNTVELPATFIAEAENPAEDLALIRANDPENRLPPPIPVDESVTAKFGSCVAVFGYPLPEHIGAEQLVLTRGIVSAERFTGLVQSGGKSKGKDYWFTEFFLTDALVAPGSSGGWVFDCATGATLGIATAAVHAKTAAFLGFVIPTRFILNFLEEAFAPKQWIGLTLQSATYELLSGFGQPTGTTEGAFVLDVETKSPADRAGLWQGDLIKKIADSHVTSPYDVHKILRKFRAGDKVSILYLRTGQQYSATLEIVPKTPAR